MLRRLTLILLAALVASSPALAEEPVFRLRAGLFTPDGGSAYWKDNAEVFDGSAEDLEDVIYGLDWNYALGRGMGVLFSGSVFKGSMDESTLEDAPISGMHQSELTLTNVTVLFTYMAPEEWRFRPWIGIGGGAYKWKLSEKGDSLDSDGDIMTGTFSEDDLALGVEAAIGLDFWIQKNWGLSADFRKHWVEDDASKSLEDRGSIDLGGQEISLGFVWMF